ncbi:hypothetical protein LOZ57_005084 [Ophidiomyces ophidiicola]|uniref:uncharacterized protein n=1 Tax=Ophidiomyces ophidiicola TaxID=1387563 RepID=UPI0020C34036|nr:uncharacterized protein LOZ57_005084 [Ophidiomyces ophidiicola]KAI1943371.1 hypothetical protein LOZ57_005084 [Ophidiomyces ophidiicola]KAI2061345.1 hypothetical protein LOZ43_001202 [Ophidiomyces ophidiicola]
MADPSPTSTPSTFFSFLRCLRYHQTPITTFRSSLSERIVNPRGHRILEDCYTAALPSDTLVRSASPLGNTTSKPLFQFGDEELLARFTRGFFGGRIFTPERLILGTGAIKALSVQLEGLKDSAGKAEVIDAISVQKPSDIPQDRLLPLKSKLYGAFQVIDFHILPTSTPIADSNSPKAPYSYIDIGFGSGRFGGCHRFSVHHQQDLRPSSDASLKKDGQTITFSLAQFTCNPIDRDDSRAAIKYLNWFHQVYAKLLFADALRGIVGHYG